MRSIALLAFTAGFVTLGVELSASRLLEPAFGNNQIVWAALIGMILLYLALGAWLGGWLADRYPERRTLDITLTLAALGVAAIPLISRGVLRLAYTGISDFAPGLLGAALVSVFLIFSLPVILLGVTSPWAVRLRLQEPGGVGSAVGRLYALSTLGSLAGAFVPVLVLIPAIGTRLTFFVLSLTLLAILTLGAVRRSHFWIPLGALIVVAALALWSARDQSIRAHWEDPTGGRIVFEDESVFNYIAVRERGGERELKLNDGIGVHSVYHPDTLLSRGIWDYFLLAPLFRQTQPGKVAAPKNLLVIGLAAGTVPALYSSIYGDDIEMTGVELDPEILEVGSRYFAMDRPNLTAVAADGRNWLARQPADARWDVIAVDAYRPPYIPFHLTTIEFFQTVRDHLSDDGVLIINVGRTDTNYDLVDAVTATVQPLFANIFLVDEPGPPNDLGNTMLVATMQPQTLEAFKQTVATLPANLPQDFRSFAQTAASYARVAPAIDAEPFTDDHAPIERLVHRIILDFMTASGG